MILADDDPLAAAATQAIRTGDLPRLTKLLQSEPALAAARIGDAKCSRTLLHVATDWPGHYPGVAATIGRLVAAGADPGGRYAGPAHRETPLHWAASSDDVEAVDALLDAGADIDADGGVLDGGTALADARIFGQWAAARRLIARGATTTVEDEATFGLVERIRARLDSGQPPRAAGLSRAFWYACHGGQLPAAQILHSHGADPNWTADWEPLTPLDAAIRSQDRNGVDAAALLAWLPEIGARRAAD